MGNGSYAYRPYTSRCSSVYLQQRSSAAAMVADRTAYNRDVWYSYRSTVVCRE